MGMPLGWSLAVPLLEKVKRVLPLVPFLVVINNTPLAPLVP
ncbi:MAG: hypothetical protein BWY72_02104 [Bacteroidetes bacterium ADurb.Bin416]|nr:MAG: hypothetical protein BWY72_02104 [Bacteroidetes bacterium ADurb.Bin416]